MFKDLRPVKTGANPPTAIEANRQDVRSARQVVADIGDAAITGRAEQIRYASDEEMIWQDRPSRALIGLAAAKLAAFCLILLIATLIISARAFPAGRRPAGSEAAAADAAGSARPPAGGTLGRTLLTDAALLAAAYMTGRFALRAARLLTTRYSATSQRLFIETGILKSVSRPYELHQLTGDAIVSKSILLRPFNVGDVVIGDVAILGINNPEYVRDVLRTGGQLEAQRADKIRWR